MNLKEAPRNTKKYLRHHLTSTVLAGSTVAFSGLGVIEARNVFSSASPSSVDIAYSDQYIGLHNAVVSINGLPEKNAEVEQARKLLEEEMKGMDVGRVYETRKKSDTPESNLVTAICAFVAAGVSTKVATVIFQDEERNKRWI